MPPVSRFFALGICVLFARAPLSAHGQQNAEGNSACAEVFKSGVYNYFAYTSGTTSAQSMKAAACIDYSAYTYDQYKLDVASQNMNSNAVSICAAAYFSSFLTSAGAEGCSKSASSMLSAGQFALLKTHLSGYQAKACSSSTTIQWTKDDVFKWSQTIDPNVYQAYIACLELSDKAGIITSTLFGSRGDNVAVGFQFRQSQAGGQASLTGLHITPENAADCTFTSIYVGPARRLGEVKGEASGADDPLPAFSDDGDAVDQMVGASSAVGGGRSRKLSQAGLTPLPPRPPPPPRASSPAIFPIRMVPLNTYTVFCRINPDYQPRNNSPADSSIDIAISNSVTVKPVYVKLYVTRNATDIITAMQDQLAAMQVQVQAQAQATTRALTALTQALTQAQTKIDALQSQVQPDKVCMGGVCLEAPATDAGGQRLFVTRKDNGARVVTIDTRPGNTSTPTNILQVHTNQDGQLPTFFVSTNQTAGFRGSNGERTGELMATALSLGWNSNTDPGKVVRTEANADGYLRIGNANRQTAVSVVVDPTAVSDIFRVHLNRNGMSPYLYVSKTGYVGAFGGQPATFSGTLDVSGTVNMPSSLSLGGSLCMGGVCLEAPATDAGGQRLFVTRKDNGARVVTIDTRPGQTSAPTNILQVHINQDGQLPTFFVSTNQTAGFRGSNGERTGELMATALSLGWNSNTDPGKVVRMQTNADGYLRIGNAYQQTAVSIAVDPTTIAQGEVILNRWSSVTDGRIKALEDKAAVMNSYVVNLQAQVSPSRLCVGNVCLSTEVYSGRLDIVRRNDLARVASISTRVEDRDILTIHTNRNGGSAYWYINTDPEFGYKEPSYGMGSVAVYPAGICMGSGCVVATFTSDSLDIYRRFGVPGGGGVAASIYTRNIAGRNSPLLRLWKDKNGQAPYYFLNYDGNHDNS